MAKSIRSKRKKKLRAEKRVKYDKKERARLFETLKNNQVVWTEAMLQYKEQEDRRKEEKEREEAEAAANKQGNRMEVSSSDVKIDSVTRLNKKGKFPVWANNRIRGQLLKRNNRLKTNRKGKLTRKRKRR